MAKRRGGRKDADHAAEELAPYEQVSPAIRIMRSADGVSLQVNAAELEEPTRAMTATYAVAVDGDDDIHLIFGQGAPGADSLSAAIVLSAPATVLGQTLYLGNPTFVPDLFGVTSSYVSELRPYDYSPDLLPSGRVLYERAAVVSFTYSEREADIRFWRVKPGEMRRTSPKKFVNAIAPVITIYLSTANLARLILSLQAIIGEP